MISFLQNTTISMVELYTADGVLVEHRLTKIALTMGSPGRLLAEHLMKVRRLYPTAITSHLQMIIANIF